MYDRAILKFRAKGMRLVTSEQFAEELGISAALVRRDLSQLGQLGTAGRGYEVESVAGAIKVVLGLDRVWDVAIVGVGLHGMAIAHHIDRDISAFRVAAAFDISDNVVGSVVNGITVRHVRDSTRTLQELDIKLGIVTVPSMETQNAINALACGGVLAILNYSSLVVEVPPRVDVIDLDLSLFLNMLPYRLTI
jgi:redox-sensing transcriptional repressor